MPAYPQGRGLTRRRDLCAVSRTDAGELSSVSDDVAGESAGPPQGDFQQSDTSATPPPREDNPERNFTALPAARGTASARARRRENSQHSVGARGNGPALRASMTTQCVAANHNGGVEVPCESLQPCREIRGVPDYGPNSPLTTRRVPTKSVPVAIPMPTDRVPLWTSAVCGCPYDHGFLGSR